MINMCFNRKYKQRIKELEEELECLKLVLLENDRRLAEDDLIIENLCDDIEDLRRQLEKKDNGKYSLFFIQPNGYKWFEEEYSIEELVKITGVSRATLMNSLTKGEPLKGGRNAKYDPKYVGSQVVDADEWYKRQS